MNTEDLETLQKLSLDLGQEKGKNVSESEAFRVIMKVYRKHAASKKKKASKK